MLSGIVRFNLYLLLALGIAVLMGCASAKPKQFKDPVLLLLHLEVNADGTDRNGPVTVHRSSPFTVNIEKRPFLTDNDITQVAVVDDSMGGFLLKVQFNRKGSWLLEQYSTASKGRRVAVFSSFRKEARWLGAPMLDRRISDGAFAFTPDATREEAEFIAKTLNVQGRQTKKDDQ